MFFIMCTSMGSMGFRTGLLKDNDKIVRFETRETAAIEARRLNVTMNASRYSTASFSYSVIERDSEF